MTENNDSFNHDLGVEHGKIVKEKLGHLYNLKPTLDYIVAHPEYWTARLNEHVETMIGVFHLSDTDRKLVDVAEGLAAPSTKLNTSQLLDKFAGRENEISTIIESIKDPASDNFRTAWKVMDEMMTGGWDMKVDKETPSDGNPRADKVKWGHVNGSNNPEIDVDFIIVHLTEVLMTLAYKDTDLKEVVSKKDWAFPLFYTGVIMDSLNGDKNSKETLNRWSRPRPDGLGWIKDERIDRYREAKKRQKLN